MKTLREYIDILEAIEQGVSEGKQEDPVEKIDRLFKNK